MGHLKKSKAAAKKSRSGGINNKPRPVSSAPDGALRVVKHAGFKYVMPLAKAFVDMLVPVHPTGYLEDTGCPMSNCADCVEARWANATGQSKYTTFLAAVERYDANTREHEAAAVRFGEALVKLGEGSITSIDPKLISGHFGLARELLAVQEGNAQEVMRLISKASSPAVTLINLGRAPPNTAVTSARIQSQVQKVITEMRAAFDDLNDIASQEWADMPAEEVAEEIAATIRRRHERAAALGMTVAELVQMRL